MLPFISVSIVTMSLHSTRTITKTEAGITDQGIVVIGLIMLLFGRIWSTLGLQTTIVIGHSKLVLRGHTSRSKEDSGAENNDDYDR